MQRVVTFGVFLVASLMMISSAYAQSDVYNSKNGSEKVQLLYNSSESKKGGGYSGGPLSIVGMIRQEKANTIQGNLSEEKKKYNPFSFTSGLGLKSNSRRSTKQQGQRRAAESKKFNQTRASKRKALLAKSKKMSESKKPESATPYRSTYRTGTSANLYKKSSSSSRATARSSSPTKTVRSSSYNASNSASRSIPSKVFNSY